MNPVKNNFINPVPVMQFEVGDRRAQLTAERSMIIEGLDANMLCLRIKMFVRKSVLFRNVPDKQAAIEMLCRAASEPGFETRLTQFVYSLREFPVKWEEIDLRDENVIHMATIAYMKEMITDVELGTVCINAAAVARCHSKEAMSVKDDGEPLYQYIPLFLPDGRENPVAMAILMQTQENHNPNYAHIIPNPYRYLFPEQFEDWIEEMRNQPTSEQYLFVSREYRFGFNWMQKYNPMQTPYYTNRFPAKRIKLPPLCEPDVMDAVYLEPGYNLFHRATNQGGMVEGYPKDAVLRLVPSCGMIDAAIKVRGGEKNRVYCFGAGKTPEEDDQRTISLPSPYAILPHRADTYPAEYEVFSDHDRKYHVPKVSLIPKAHRDLFKLYANELEKELQYYWSDKEPLSTEVAELINRIRDMELTFYEPEGHFKLYQKGVAVTPEAQFWYSMNAFLGQTVERSRLKRVLKRQHLPQAELEKFSEQMFIGMSVDTKAIREINALVLRTVFIDHPQQATDAGVSLVGLRAINAKRLELNYIWCLAKDAITAVLEEVVYAT